MSNYFTAKYLSATEDNFLRQQLVPYLKRQFRMQQETDSSNTIAANVIQAEHSTQTNFIETRKFDPIAIFYDQINTQPSTREIVAQTRSEMQRTHERTMTDALQQLTISHREATEVLNRCLQAERTARALERQSFAAQLQQSESKITELSSLLQQKVCSRCKNDLERQNDVFIQNLMRENESCKQQNLEQTYRISELEQYMAQCVSDLRLAVQEKQVMQRRMIQLEESLKLHQDVLQKLNLANLLSQQPLDLLITNVSQSRSASTDVANSQPFTSQVQQQKRPDAIVFDKDTTPPAVPHVQYPPMKTASSDVYLLQSAPPERVNAQVQPHAKKRLSNEPAAKAQTSVVSQPERPERIASSVKVSDVVKIQKVDSIMSDEEVVTVVRDQQSADFDDEEPEVEVKSNHLKQEEKAEMIKQVSKVAQEVEQLQQDIFNTSFKLHGSLTMDTKEDKHENIYSKPDDNDSKLSDAIGGTKDSFDW